MSIAIFPPNGRAPAASIDAIIESVAKLLPEQAPLHAFVHHNTLHAFEHLPFTEAVVEASRILGTEPFMSEAAFAGHLDSGRIRPGDLKTIVEDGAHGASAVVDGITLGAFRYHRLCNLFPIPSGQALQFHLEESTAKTQFDIGVSAPRRVAIVNEGTSEAQCLKQLWQALEDAAPVRHSAQPQRGRRRDDLLTLTGDDTDTVAHPLLIRLAGAFLDQGVAYWSMPDRDRGFLHAVRSLYRLGAPSPDNGLRGLATTLKAQEAAGWDVGQTISWALAELQIPAERYAAFIRETLLSLRGWAGMMHHLEVRPDRVPVHPVVASLRDYLAVQLVLDTVAAKNTLRRHLGPKATFRTLRFDKPAELAARKAEGHHARTALVYEAFVLAQRLPIALSTLNVPENARRWLTAVGEFSALERRKLLHLAYERRHRVECLDGLVAHCAVARPAPPQAAFQASFCIDDREESLRRHLEEIFPAAETYGYAGFFGVAMQYQSIDDVRPSPLCPVSIRPEHLVVERVVDAAEEKIYRARRRKRGALSQAVSVGDKTLTRGGVLTMVLGVFSVAPLVMRSLFPRLASSWSHRFSHRAAPPPATELQVERRDDADAHALRAGYTIDEMVGVVASALKTMGLRDSLCPIVLMVGHGSSSLNNPHEAAHDCGATGGGRGGPNARAFCIMANHPEVRSRLAAAGLTIPDATWFLAGYHNTCDDSMTYYDADRVPAEHAELVATIRRVMDEACVHDAHERCRRFETAPTKLALGRALNVAKQHANDLAEPRPEYGHATNALCIVGRRARTRGLFLDRRAFLVSYDPTDDVGGELLTELLLSVGPVGAGINLEYYFSFVDPTGYGSGTKLPHNITGLVGVMDGHSTDLRTGLPWQMVEIHEPVRLLNIVEARVEVLEAALATQPALQQLVGNGWIQLVAWDPDSAEMHVYEDNGFRLYTPETEGIKVVQRSAEHYGGQLDHLPLAHIAARSA